MTLHKCDKCKKSMSYWRLYSVGRGLGGVELCQTCFRLYCVLLQKDGLLSEELAEDVGLADIVTELIADK
jgi:hypothetical protein